MATVEVTFTALPAHVRTARLVATAVARRSGVAESLMDEVRLAVGEACSRAVETHAMQCPDKPVRLALSNQAGRFQIEVVNAGRPAQGPLGASGGRGAERGGSALIPPGFSRPGFAGLPDDVGTTDTPPRTPLQLTTPPPA